MPRYEPMIRAKLRENGVPEDMVYLALIESGFSNRRYQSGARDRDVAVHEGYRQAVRAAGRLLGG